MTPSDSLALPRGVILCLLLPLGIVPMAGPWLGGDGSPFGALGIPLMVAITVPHWGPMLLVSVGATWFAHGGRDSLAGLRFVVGFREKNLAGARRSLTTAARTVTLVGIALAILPFLHMASMLSEPENPSPAVVAEAISQIVLLPIGVVAFGRIALASAADHASALLGEPRVRVFRTWHDLALFVLLPTTAMALLSTVMRFP